MASRRHAHQESSSSPAKRFARFDDIASDVTTHFRINIPSGQSSFTVQVPKHHVVDAQRRFFFNELHVLPEFFSLEAEKLKLDADPQLDKMVERDIHVRIDYNDPKTAYGAPFDHGAVAFNTSEFLAKLNKHFEKEKPAYAHTTPFFVDWTDADLHTRYKPAEYVPLQCMVYYGEPFNEAKHFDALPASVRDIEGVNNYIPPVGGTMEVDFTYLNRIRLRIWLAPYTKAVFSNVKLFVDDLGFSKEDLGTLTNRQYHLSNDKPYWTPVAFAEAAPKLELSKMPFKLSIYASDNPILSRIKRIQMVERDWFDDSKVTDILTQAFQQSSKSTNTVFSLTFDAAAKKYKILFPDAGNATVSIVCEPEFAHRLGFGYQNQIVRGMTAEAQKDRHSNEDAHKRALSVVYDTGPIACQYDQVASNTTSGLTDKTVASLYPTMAGTLSMPSRGCLCALTMGGTGSSADSFPIVVNTQSTSARVPVTFHLKRIYDDQAIADFVWNCNAHVYGVLQGSCPRV